MQADLGRLLWDSRAEGLSAELTRFGQQLDQLVQELSDLPGPAVHNGELPASAAGASATKSQRKYHTARRPAVLRMVVAQPMMDAPLILLADDSREILVFLTDTILKPAGYAVQAVTDGLSALTLARQLQPDLLITDQNMPNLTGLELIRRVPPPAALPGHPDHGRRVGVAGCRGVAALAPATTWSSHSRRSSSWRLSSGRCRRAGNGSRCAKHRRAPDETTDDVKRRLNELEGLAQIGRAVTAMLDLDAILTTAVDSAVKLTGAEEGSLLLLDEQSSELYMRSSKNFDEEFSSTFRLRVQDSLAGQVIASGQPVLLDERSPQKIKTSYLVHSLLYVPLQVRGRTIGVLGVDNRKAGRALTQEDVTVMSAIADYAAIAIDNARLYQKTEADLRKLETVLTQTEDGVLLVDLDNRLLMANGSACLAFGISGVLIGRSLVELFDDPSLLELVRPGPSAATQRDLGRRRPGV